jgi:hypothetical protein
VPEAGGSSALPAHLGPGHNRALSSMELYQPMRMWLVPQSDRSDGHILGMMAVSLTYFSTSAKRIVDAVPMHVLHYMVARCAAAAVGRHTPAAGAGAVKALELVP